MNELRASVRAQCEACSATYRVPTAERTYICKACKGTVRAIAGPKSDEIATSHHPGVECPECQARNPGGLHFCSECGTSLPETSGAETPAARKLRKEASEALQRVSRGFQLVTWTYHAGAVVYAIAALFAVLALARPEVPKTDGIIVVALTTLLSVLFGMAALHAHFRPFVWTLALAIATTAVTVIHIIGPNPLGLAALGSAAWAVVAFGLLMPTYWFRGQIDKHKDLYILHHAGKETRRSLTGRSAVERHQRLLDVMRRDARRAWGVSTAITCLVVLASVIGTNIYLGQRPAPFGPALDRFEAAWATGRIEPVGDVFDDEYRKLGVERLRGAMEGHGWGSNLPQLDDGKVDQSGGRATATYDVADLAVTVTWTLVGKEWKLDQIEVPTPDYRPTLARFRTAWTTSDPEQIVQFFSPDGRPEMLTKLQSAIDKRNWERLPPILEQELNEQDPTHVGAVYSGEHGKVTVQWYYFGGSWRISKMKLPWR